MSSLDGYTVVHPESTAGTRGVGHVAPRNRRACGRWASRFPERLLRGDALDDRGGAPRSVTRQHLPFSPAAATPAYQATFWPHDRRPRVPRDPGHAAWPCRGCDLRPLRPRQGRAPRPRRDRRGVRRRVGISPTRTTSAGRRCCADLARSRFDARAMPASCGSSRRRHRRRRRSITRSATGMPWGWRSGRSVAVRPGLAAPEAWIGARSRISRRASTTSSTAAIDGLRPVYVAFDCDVLSPASATRLMRSAAGDRRRGEEILRKSSRACPLAGSADRFARER